MRILFGAALGRRLPALDGSLGADVEAEVAIRRDGYGIPHIEAASDADAWYGLGFCYGQDRAFQMEMYLRVTRGTLAALIGKDGLPIDRLARRVGFRRAAQAQLPLLDPDIRRRVESFVAGFNAGAASGGRRRPHEFVLLRARPTVYDAADAVALVKLQSFNHVTNWDVELARWLILRADGPDALRAIDPSYPPWLPVTAPPGAGAGPAIDRLREDIAALAAVTGGAGGSNCWVLAGSRTASGRPLLAGDPHLFNDLPGPWYLAHLRTPDWEAAGLTLGPAFVAGHNGHAAWGVTYGYADNSDLFIEQIGPDGVSVRRGGQFVPCEVREETIEVRGADPVVEKVLVTSHGPVIGPALEGEVGAVALRATWLTPAPLRGLLAIHRATDFEAFRRCFDPWPAISLNYLYADVSGTIGWQLAGDVPRRRSGWGLLPAPGWDPGAGWLDGPVPFDAMPHAQDPGCGFLAAANNKPVADDEHAPFLGADWLDGFRLQRITDMLASRRDWDIPGTQRLQLDVHSVVWEELREVILAAPADDPAARRARDMLADWDGNVESDSPAATVFEELLDELARCLAAAAAPRSAAIADGLGFHPLVPAPSFVLRRRGRLARALRAPEADRVALGLAADDIAAALAAVARRLADRHGHDPAAWAWGRIEPLWLRHPLGQRRPLDRIFDRGPLPGRGDPDTIAQYTIVRAAPGKAVIPSARIVIDLGDWEAARFAVPGGQSGNPLSARYDDLLGPWRDGRGVPLAWTSEAVTRATAHTLQLSPGGRRPEPQTRRHQKKQLRTH